jgi:hypothetical protein
MTRLYSRALPLLVATMMVAALVTSETTSAKSHASEDESSGYLKLQGEVERRMS